MAMIKFEDLRPESSKHLTDLSEAELGVTGGILNFGFPFLNESLNGNNIGNVSIEDNSETGNYYGGGNKHYYKHH